MTFKLADIPATVAEDEGGLPLITVDPGDLYRGMIKRILEVLGSGEKPHELGISVYLVDEARTIPAKAWEDALKPRDEFHAAPFAAFAHEGKPNYTMLNLLEFNQRQEIERMVWRGLALELARRWYSRSLPNVFGHCSLHILAGDKSFRL